MVIDAASHEGQHSLFSRRNIRTCDRKISRIAGERIILICRAAQCHPFHSKRAVVEFFNSRIISRHHFFASADSILADYHRHFLSFVEEIRPAIFSPFYRKHECLTSQILMVALQRTDCEKHSPPSAVIIFYKIGMTSTCYRIYTIAVEITLSENRIAIPGLIRAERGGASVDHLAVVHARTSFCCHQEIFTVYLIYMRPFTPNRLFLRANSFINYYFAGSDTFIGGCIEFYNPYCTMPRIFRIIVRSIIVVHDISLSVLIKEECRINALHFG